MYYVKVVLASENPDGKKIYTLEWRFPRVVLAETVTHRRHLHDLGIEETLIHDTTTTDDLSKNSASSRAIPIQKMIEDVEKNPYVPSPWSKNQAGMTESEYLQGEKAIEADRLWMSAMTNNIYVLKKLSDLGVHKQDANRLIEPWAWTTQVVTATEWDNFFALRCDQRAHPAFRILARMAYLAIQDSKPQKLKWNQWHLPYIRKHELQRMKTPDLLKISTARVAWTSYAAPDKTDSIEKAMETYHKLVGGTPRHASPMEAQAQAKPLDYFDTFPQHRSNLVAWLQHRKLLPDENVNQYHPDQVMVESWRTEIQCLGYTMTPFGN